MSVDVCVEITSIIGTVSQMSTLEIQTASGSATCKLLMLCITIFNLLLKNIMNIYLAI